MARQSDAGLTIQPKQCKGPRRCSGQACSCRCGPPWARRSPGRHRACGSAFSRHRRRLTWFSHAGLGPTPRCVAKLLWFVGRVRAVMSHFSRAQCCDSVRVHYQAEPAFPGRSRSAKSGAHRRPHSVYGNARSQLPKLFIPDGKISRYCGSRAQSTLPGQIGPVTSRLAAAAAEGETLPLTAWLIRWKR
jgi:hypothetical protein